MHQIGKSRFLLGLTQWLWHLSFTLFVIGSSIWLSFALWIQQPIGYWPSIILIVLWVIFSLSVLGIYVQQRLLSRNKDMLLYSMLFALSLLWYFNIPAQQDRDWNPEVARVLHYERQDNQVTIHNIRNFAWTSEQQYQQRWETRHYDLNKISGINIITSYWMGPQIAHTLVSFDFADQSPLVFSIEIRKEKNESFSAIGGFFRQFELSLVAADEKDILYTRSNIRKEDVYFYPIKAPKIAMQELFLEYLAAADELAQRPKWYNTVSSNCTTLIFDMARVIEPDVFPKDYRLLLSGYLPNYLYDIGALDQHWSIQQWYQHAHVNPRVANFEQLADQSSEHYSKLIRTGLPIASIE
ncbi:Lnb N-terminal periplasmic domain-containing protein [Acinetobacter larvae]|uniref:Lnb N-terminal periplasmic domain-containing protein n=1 Tax=Acinetobacter larvae TaxID=1789224 RepID=A0A1B2M2J5_9GAMM|nr:DUF4105 domain-containing protein [Acinetobacter larvae]AOA59420.1 hypothetical protein BFG52_14385 [Acinetobacter larvae]